jgi:hypothetical protein
MESSREPVQKIMQRWSARLVARVVHKAKSGVMGVSESGSNRVLEESNLE